MQPLATAGEQSAGPDSRLRRCRARRLDASRLPGVRHLLVSARPQTSDLPKAHVLR